MIWYPIIGVIWSAYLENASKSMPPPMNEPWTMLQRIVSILLWPIGVYNWLVGFFESDD